MSSYKTHAFREFRAAGWVDENGKFKNKLQEEICNDVLKLIDVFEEQGHSGTTSRYAINLFSKLAEFDPITPLTGEDWEWNHIADERTNGVSVYQNNRCSAVFKQADRHDGKPYYLDGKVFWEWVSYPDIDDGKPFKTHYTSSESSVVIEFPWKKPESPEYVFVPTEKFPNESLLGPSVYIPEEENE